ncbi:MAG: bifunctional demethylmenaquinone methyltransferase/2-methoxy-6-polyprenyl-1,4-benzoquinol methylase UbiE [Desulfatibacillaceae bacterium]
MSPRELPFVRQMFDDIAPKYDFLNRVLSLRRDVAWRREAVSRLPEAPELPILDSACGTADVAMEAALARPGSFVVGLDFSSRMLALAEKKIRRAGLAQRISLVHGDALATPFPDGAFSAATMAFGFRNVMDKPALLEEFHRVLAPGGRLLILELTTPSLEPLRTLYRGYFEKVLPAVGRQVSRHGSAYAYLPDSVARFPDNPLVAAMIRGAGFMALEVKPLSLGICTLFDAMKPV